MCTHVCNDLMVDIFETLPPRSIIRFRSLSRYWHSRLATTEFIRNHRLRCSKNPKKILIRQVLFYRNRYALKDIYTLHAENQLPSHSRYAYIGIPKVEFPFYEFSQIKDLSSVVGSCNGILCLYDREEISLWNFSIRRRLTVPRHPPLKCRYSELSFGFGFDPITDDYKIVGISVNTYVSDNINIFIYSLKTDSWCTISSPRIRLDDVLSPNACCLNGILHWVVNGWLTTQQMGTTCFILTFNLNSHVFGHIVLPEPLTVKQLTTINGCLAIISLDGFERYQNSCFWMMKEYGKKESWSMLFEIKRHHGDNMTVFLPVTEDNIRQQFYVYNPQTMSKTNIFTSGYDCRKFEMDTYAESLELIDKERARTCGKTIFSDGYR